MKKATLFLRLNIYGALTIINVYNALYSDTYLLTSRERDRLIRALNILHEAILMIEKGYDFGSEITHYDLVEGWENGAKLLENQYDAIHRYHLGEC